MSHRAVLLAAISNGTCVIRGFLPSQDCQCTVNAMREFGIAIDQPDETTLVVHGQRGSFQPPKRAIDCGNSGNFDAVAYWSRLGAAFETKLIGDASLSSRPMRRVIEPLTQMGASITATEPKGTAPWSFAAVNCDPIRYELPVASAQVKSAILFASLKTSGKTVVVEPLRRVIIPRG
jgi:3-phosphoshikimate 1-carboxyvinyltransferase